MKPLSFVFLLLFLVSCSMEPLTSRFVQDFDFEEGADDDLIMAKSIENLDAKGCQSIVFSLKEEECIVTIARTLKDPKVCNLIEDQTMREGCMSWS